MLVGYARVSTLEQTLALQQDALTQAGCERLFTDTAFGSRTDRTGLAEALGFLRDGQDTLVVWRLDRLGRSLRACLRSRHSGSWGRPQGSSWRRYVLIRHSHLPRSADPGRVRADFSNTLSGVVSASFGAVIVLLKAVLH